MKIVLSLALFIGVLSFNFSAKANPYENYLVCTSDDQSLEASVNSIAGTTTFAITKINNEEPKNITTVGIATKGGITESKINLKFVVIISSTSGQKQQQTPGSLVAKKNSNDLYVGKLAIKNLVTKKISCKQADI